MCTTSVVPEIQYEVDDALIAKALESQQTNQHQQMILDDMASVVGRLVTMGKDIGAEIDAQNEYVVCYWLNISCTLWYRVVMNSHVSRMLIEFKESADETEAQMEIVVNRIDKLIQRTGELRWCSRAAIVIRDSFFFFFNAELFDLRSVASHWRSRFMYGVQDKVVCAS